MSWLLALHILVQRVLGTIAGGCIVKGRRYELALDLVDARWSHYLAGAGSSGLGLVLGVLGGVCVACGALAATLLLLGLPCGTWRLQLLFIFFVGHLRGSPLLLHLARAFLRARVWMHDPTLSVLCTLEHRRFRRL